MHIRRLIPLAVLAWAAAWAWPAHAEDKTARSLAATCTGCHGTNGVSSGGIPSIAGLDQARIVTLVQEFRDGKRPSTVMQQHAKGYTDEQIALIAAWFAAQK